MIIPNIWDNAKNGNQTTNLFKKIQILRDYGSDGLHENDQHSNINIPFQTFHENDQHSNIPMINIPTFQHSWLSTVLQSCLARPEQRNSPELNNIPMADPVVW